ncbi:HAMP domain-containing sensor histidine kinase [Pseudoalteromonas sp. MMG005]|uniref:sensor histidine kinase n=1 Tax=Pseudoalteromonas sp. MMG005 TaxID=2822682 RepID=UPI001B3A560F|nr:HAMP domain-containing sensor histidine kinase [Pseudoalteromonas sp. MMG005]MBQ4846146.1 HAMP domain-containing histidine kinase [Pseudoalteromonas sp. MMG005]
MNKLIMPFFTRLYGLLFLAIFCSVFVTIFILDKWNERDAIADFVTDTLFVKHVLENQRKMTKTPADIFYRGIDNSLYPFDFIWLGSDNISLSCPHCTFIARYNNADVYQLKDEALLSIHSVEDSSDKLIIKDKQQEFSLQEYALPTSSFDIEVYAPFIVLIVIVVVIGVVLYLSIRKLQKEINHLNQMSYQFGKGDLAARVKPLSEPLTVLATSFNSMATALSNKMNESQIFAQAVPHELRTPLSRIQLASGILRKHSLTSEQLALIDNIDQYICDIDELCTQIIQFSKLNMQVKEDGNKTFNLNRFIAYRVEQLTLRSVISINTLCCKNITVYCNSTHLRLIIDNLLKNAAQHAKQQVDITVISTKGVLKITIEDDGKGISKHDHDTIFVPYARLDSSRTRKTGGLGMGLAIVKGAVNQLGGEVSVARSSSGGAMFIIKLPIL